MANSIPILIVMGALLTALACSKTPAPICPEDGGAAVTADGGLSGDGGLPEDGGIAADGGPATAALCRELNLPRRDFIDVQADDSLYARAANFTVPTLKGGWNLKENWSGCESYLFIQDAPRQTAGWPIPLWDRDVSALFMYLPRNVHLFFVSTSSNSTTRQAALAGLKSQVDQVMNGLGQARREEWQMRIHYITEAASALPGWLGAVMRNPGWGVGIDRLQRIRYIGSYADYRRYDSGRQWFAPNLSMVANEAIHYNFEGERDGRLKAQNATVVPLFTGGVITGSDHVTATLPDSAAMAAFDSMEFDLSLTCDGVGEYGTCPAWDRLVYVYLCEQANPDSCDAEIGRWITTYHREGRWVHDVSGLLPLLAAGGQRRFRFHTQDPYEVTLSIRLYNQGKAFKPVEALPLYAGHVTFDAAYNDAYQQMSLPIPQDAVKVELATVITGHGMSNPGNCAEFCDTTHHFFVNGTENVRSFPETAHSGGCMDQVKTGTVPNQYGTWWYGRSGWCPGKDVPMVMIDITNQVVPGTDNTFSYKGFYQGAPYSGDSWKYIMLASWVVISR